MGLVSLPTLTLYSKLPSFCRYIERVDLSSGSHILPNAHLLPETYSKQYHPVSAGLKTTLFLNIETGWGDIFFCDTCDSHDYRYLSAISPKTPGL